MSAPRPIRIPRSLDGTDGSPADTKGSGSGEYRENRGGTTRALRVYLLFLLVLVVLYATFLGLALTSSSPGLSTNYAVLAGFSAIALALAIVGWFITLGRAPRGVRFKTSETMITERTRRVRRFPPAPSLTVRVVGRYPSNLLSPEPTELVELLTETHGTRVYLVEAGLLPSEVG